MHRNARLRITRGQKVMAATNTNDNESVTYQERHHLFATGAWQLSHEPVPSESSRQFEPLAS